MRLLPHRLSGRFPLLCLMLVLNGIFNSVLPAVANDESTWKITGPHADATISLEPPRILAYAPDGTASRLFTDPTGVRSGIRFIALEEIEGKLIIHAFDAPGKWLAKSADNAEFSVGSQEGAATVKVHVSLDPESNQMTLACHLRNDSPRKRELALWAILSLPPEGWWVTTLSRGIEQGERVHGRVTGFWFSPFNAPGLELGDEAISLNLAHWPRTPSIKYGTRSNAGWIAAFTPDLKSALIGSTNYASTDRYPDEDCNVEMWLGGTIEKVTYGEIEWLSAWHPLDPGAEFPWELKVRNAPTEVPADPRPDDLVQAVRKPTVLPAKTPPQSSTWELNPASGLRKDSLGHVTAILAGETVLAKAPLWFNAPIWRDAPTGPALEFGPDTLLEAVGETVPKWSPTGREWRIKLTPAEPKAPTRQLLFHDGNKNSGLALYLEQGLVTAIMWSKDESCQAAAPYTQDGKPTDIQVTLVGKSLTLRIGSSDPVETTIPFTSPTPARRLGLLRNAAWPDFLKPAEEARFTGALYGLQVRSLELWL